MPSGLNYAIWKKDHESILKTFKDKKIIMLFSGGKDCSIILHYLLKAGKEFGFQFETVSATFPNHVFTKKEVKILDNYWRSRKVDILWETPKITDLAFTEEEKKGGNPCYVCHKTKREMLINYLNRIHQKNKEIVIIISYTLWDIVSYSVEFLTGGVYTKTGDAKTSKNKINLNDKRFIETSQRFYQYLTLIDGISVFKPLLKYNDQDIMKEALKHKIPVSTIKCRYKKFRPKRTLSDYYKGMELSFDYDEVLKFYEKSLKMYDVSYYAKLNKESFFKIL